MKILLYADGNPAETKYVVDYLREVHEELMNDLIVIDNSMVNDINEWASQQEDFTYVYFEERNTPGSALNQVIDGLDIKEDILIMDEHHIPLVNSISKMQEVLCERKNAFAVGPVSNSFIKEQYIEWKDAEDAISWSESSEGNDSEEVLFLNGGVIMFSGNVVYSPQTFSEEFKSIVDVITEKCIREFLDHKRMYVCKNSGFWDIKYEKNDKVLPSADMLAKCFGIHYFNVWGNECIVDTISECDIPNDKEIRVLEVGCDCGGTLLKIKKMFDNTRLYGTDINENALRFTSEFAEVKVNNIEDNDLDFATNDFDFIIFADVLEHLRDPLKTILFCKKLLKPDGRIVASIPNLMNISVMKELLNGNFTYTDIGLMDRTHIHMFTYNEIIRLFENEAGYRLEKITMNKGDYSNDDIRLMSKLMELGSAEEFMYQAFQYQIVARKRE